MKCLHIALSRPSADYHESSYDATIIIMIMACKIDGSNREVYVYYKYDLWCRYQEQLQLSLGADSTAYGRGIYGIWL